jgi:protein O-GlcNAc transferase
MQKIEARFIDAVTQHQNGNLAAAEAGYRWVIAHAPLHCFAFNNLGTLLHRQRQFDSAVQCYREALRIQPDYPDACNNLGTALKALGRLDEAVAAYREALRIKPDYHDAHYNLGNVLHDQRQLDQAIAAYQEALRLKPDYPEVWNNLGSAYKRQGKLEEAIACFKKSLALRPDKHNVHNNLLYAMQSSAEHSQAEAFAAHLAFAERFETPLQKNWRAHLNTPDPNKRLKVGYVSADFRQHAVANFIEPVLAHHDKTQVEIACYYNDIRQDSVTDRIRSLADHWTPCVGISDEQLAERIRSDGIDILVDLSGHTGGNRLLAFARKPAPVQITYLGYPGTSGLSAIDYRITDHDADPQGSEQYYREKLLRLPHSLCCYRPATGMPDVSPLPALQNGFPTFGSFNNFNKIDHATIALWARILNALPGARLLMLTVPEGERRQWLARQFDALGISAERLEFRGFLPMNEFQEVFRQVDIALDPLQFAGGTTTCESLWMGVPVIMQIGQRLINRIGYSFLHAAGFPMYAAASLDDYVRIAIETASQLPQLAQLRSSMREQLAVSPLMDETGFTRNLEQAYRTCWMQWCKN